MPGATGDDPIADIEAIKQLKARSRRGGERLMTDCEPHVISHSDPAGAITVRTTRPQAAAQRAGRSGKAG